MNTIRNVWLTLLFGLSLFSIAGAQSLDLKSFSSMKARSIGPAGMSGRVTAIDVIHSRPEVIYIGTASGGLWRSKSGGVTWEPLFDDQAVASIGAVAIVQNNPDVIWVGTGEGNPRNSQSAGYGVYRSLDGGQTWQCMGLEETHNIHRVIVDPRDENTVYVGAQGPAWGESEWRGVFKTTNAGESWEKVLYVDEGTGIADLVLDPQNPNKLIAATWEFRRWPWFFNSGGPGSGIHVTFDGGKSWSKRSDKDGLPKGNLGRIGLAIAPSQPNRVYAIVESKKNAFYRSDDGGMKWRKINDKSEIGNRPFYYADIYVDPVNENRIYSIFSTVALSEDGGKSFRTLLPYYGDNAVHPDHHAWWIHPQDPNYIIEGNDGGMAISRDRGKTWRFVENLPLAQFYHINIDNEWPYNVYGGMQDNGSWKGPAYGWNYSGIRNAYWTEVSFGDGFDVLPDPENSRYGYSMSQGGNLYRYDSETGHTKNLQPVRPNDSMELRFHWNAGIAQDPFDPATIYYGSQFVHKSSDRGDSWTIISPDLTTNDTSKQKQAESGGLTLDVTDAENHTTILAISPSALDRELIWVSTDDGNLQLSRNGGQDWTELSKGLPGMPEAAWIPQVHVSSHDTGEAFVVVNNYRQNDWKPYLYHTKDYGQTWTSLVDEDKVWGHCLSVVQDPVAPNLLFLGTEYGLYVSIDYGANWNKWTAGYPTVATIDMKIHPREHDLVIGTFGRAAYVLDDIRPLRELAREGVELMDKELHVFGSGPGVQASYQRPPGTRYSASGMFQGENRRNGALISYWVKEGKKEKGGRGRRGRGMRQVVQGGGEHDGKKGKEKKSEIDSLHVQIFNADREMIRKMALLPDSGLNRMYWDMRREGVKSPSRSDNRNNGRRYGGFQVLPGTYLVHMSYKGVSDSTEVEVLFDPRIETTPEALEARLAARDQHEVNIKRSTAIVDQLKEAKKTVELLMPLLSDEEDTVIVQLKKDSKSMQDSIKTLMSLVLPEPSGGGYTKEPDIVYYRLIKLSSRINSSYDEPGATVETLMNEVEDMLDEIIPRINSFFENDWKAYQEAMEAAPPNPFKEVKKLE